MAFNLLPRVSILCFLAVVFLSSHFADARKINGLKKSGVSIEVVKHPNWTPKQIPITEVYASVFLKHNKAMPPALRNEWGKLKANRLSGSSSRRRSTLVSTADTGGFYTTLFRWGTPEQPTYLMVDTGSSDVWAYGWLMASQVVSGTNHAFDLTGHRYYNGTASSTGVVMPGESFEACYGGGCVYGEMWTDTIYVDTFSISENPVPAIWYEEVSVYDNLGIDGIFGLGNAYWDSEFPDPQEALMAYMLPQFILQLFTITLIQGGGGSLDLGVIDSTKHTGSIAYTPVTTVPGTTGGYWAFNWTGFKIGSSTWNTSSIQFVTDTGAPFSTLPPSVLAVFWSQVTGAVKASDGSWSYPCANGLPDLIIGVGTARVKIHSEHLVGGTTSTPGYCFGAIQTGGEHDYQFFGWPFMTSLFLVHDYGNMRMGFANRTN